MRKLCSKTNLLVLAITFIVTSCITTHHTNYLQAPKNFIPAYKDTFSYRDYHLKECDRLYIQVYSTDDKTNVLFNGSSANSMQMMSGGGSGSGDNLDLYTYLVQSNGNIAFPIVGEIYVKGSTIRQTKEIIENAIKPILKVNSVDVRMIGRSFSVIGSGKSGRFPFPREKLNIFQALALAGDFNQFTDRSKIKILRIVDNQTVIKSFDIRSLDIINSEFYYLEPDDIIFLQPLNEQFFGATTLWTTISTIITTVSFGVLIYNFFVPKAK